MPDITMCDGYSETYGFCPLRENCYRFTATPNEYRQSYFVIAPFKVDSNHEKGYKDTTCEHYTE